MVIITINGKKTDREFPNMAHALAFAYQNGECYGADVVELAVAGKGGKSVSGKGGGFTQADIDAACEEAVQKAAETLAAQIEAKDAEIAELKNQLAAKEAEATVEPVGEGGENPVDPAGGGQGGTAETNPEPADGSTPVTEQEADVDNADQA